MAEDEDKRKLALRFQEQCYLMKFWKTIVDQGREKLSARSTETSGPYKNFFQLETDKPYEYNNVVFRKTKNPEKLLELTTAQLSLLVPQVDVYKETKIPKRDEFITVPLPFDDITQRSKVENMMKTASGRGGGVGLKSFSWKSIGTNPANKYSFEAQLVLHFQDIGELFETRNTATLETGEQVEVKFSDLILSQAKFRKNDNEGSFTYNRDYFRIKVVCGWNVPKSLNVPLIDKELVDAIHDTKVFFYLGLKSHELDFRDDGTVELRIDYIAYSDSLTNDPLDSNILYEDAKLRKQRKKYAEKIARLNEIIQEAEGNVAERRGRKKRTTGDSIYIQGRELTIKKTQEEIENLEKQLEESEARTRDESYRRILNGLFNQGRIYSVLANQDFFEKNVESVLYQKETKAGDVIQTKKDTEDKNKEKGPGPSVQEPGNDVDPNFSKESLDGLSAEDSVGNLSNRLLELSQTPEFYGKDEKTRIVKFFYLGDLFEVVLDGMFSDESLEDNVGFSKKELRVILGSITIVDYGSEEDSGFVMRDLVELKGGRKQFNRVMTGKRVSVPISLIPISVRVFAAWFRNNIMEQQKTREPFKNFVESVIDDLVIRSLASDCFEKAPRHKARLRYKSFSAPKNDKREALFKKGLTTVEEFAKQGCEFRMPINKQGVGLQKAGDIHNYLLIYGDQENPYQLKGDIDKDREKGIYHLFFGNEYGLVKKMQFKRDDMPFMREANFVNNTKGKHDASKILREKYNVNIEMVGNNLFDVGSKVRIHPTIPGSGKLETREKVMLDLGVGGYFDIIENSNTIEDGKFSTTLDARWQARGDGTANIGDKEIELIPASEIDPNLIVGSARIQQSGTGPISVNPDAKKAEVDVRKVLESKEEREQREANRQAVLDAQKKADGYGFRPRF